MATAIQTQPLPALPGAHALRHARRWLILALLAAAAAAAIVLYLRARAARASPQLKLESAAVTRGPLRARVTATGTLSALVTVQVGSQVSGRVQQILVDFNSPVTKGQLIARIDPTLFEAAAEQARANDLAADANVEKAVVQAQDAQRQWARTKALAAEKLVAQADLDTAQANLDAANANVNAMRAVSQQTQAALNQARTNLAYTRILSPIDGIVISRNVDVGQTVAAAFQSPTLFVLAEDLRRMQVDTSVAEGDVGRLRAGMRAQFSVDAYPGRVFAGTVRQIRNAAQTLQNVVTYDAVIDVPNPDLELKPGMTANVTFVYADRKDALLVPNAALRFRPPAELTRGVTLPSPKGDERVVWLEGRAEEKPKPIVLRPGVTDGTSTEVLEGAVAPGDKLLTEAVGPGRQVRMF